MCGIAGYATSSGDNGLDESFLRRTCETLRHRGPDGDGVWLAAGVGLAHRRLAIIDLASGAQPMSYLGRYHITFNGEIYNYRELRQRLAGKGHRFQTSSDTEVILAAFAEWDEDAPMQLRGIFAFAIWDAERRRLFLARDQLGVKPLLYSADPSAIVFASELKAILEAPSIPRDIDREGLADYLALGYAIGEKTILRGIRRLRAGSTLTWDAGHTRLQRYFDLAPEVLGPSDTRSDAKLIEEFDGRLEEAVRLQLVSDVRVGAFLSGGLDSSAIVEHMRRRTSQAPLTFSMGFAESNFSELGYAQEVARFLRTDHRQELAKGDIAAELPTLVRAFDEPLGDSSTIPTFQVSRLARSQVKVVLSGDGADEIFAGYTTYTADALQRYYRALPEWLHRGIALPLSRSLPPSRRKVGLDYKLRQFVAHAHGSPERAHFGWRLLFDQPARLALLDESAGGYDPFDAYQTFYDEVRGAEPLNRSLYVDIQTWLVNDILPKVDRASMAVGLEARVPYLDHELVGFAMRLPRRLKMHGLRRKVVLRLAMRGRLPESVLRRRKSGFNSPVSDWLRGPLRPVMEDALGRPSTLVHAAHPTLQGLWRAHLGKRVDAGFPLWTLLTLLLWERHVLRPTSDHASHLPDIGTTS
jgi:asparagine synthase (glutamine-hydrolysing)